MNQRNLQPVYAEERLKNLKQFFLAASLENGVLRQKLRAAKHRIGQFESIEFAKGDLRHILKTQEQLQEEIRENASCNDFRSQRIQR